MTLTLNLSPELETLLRHAADNAGMDVEAFVLRTVRERVAESTNSEGPIRDDAEWQTRFQAWLATHKPAGHFVDDSRESIYD
jgi:uncharacterized protein (DUF1778 family)